LQQVGRAERLLAARLTDLVDRLFEKVVHADAGQLHRILKRQEDALLGALVWFVAQNVLAFEEGGAAVYLVLLAARQHLR
jgi:hypothetical protein